jgi:hypothetical protein
MGNRGLLAGQTVREEVMARGVGIVGIGIMGTAMMRNLVKDGFEVVGYDIAEVAMARLIESGGIAAASPRDVAEKTEILITSLPNVDAFERVMTGQGGVASSNGMGQIVIECSTLPIEVKARGEEVVWGRPRTRVSPWALRWEIARAPSRSRPTLFAGRGSDELAPRSRITPSIVDPVSAGEQRRRAREFADRVAGRRRLARMQLLRSWQPSLYTRRVYSSGL